MPLIPQQKLAARKLGVSATALRQWQGEPGFPHNAGGYDLDAIRAWLAAKGSPKADADEPADGTLGAKMAKAKVIRATHEARIAKVKADEAERAAEIAKGNILPRDEFALSITEHLQLARDRLLTVPRTLCRHVPKKYHRTLQAEGDREVRKILEELARGLDTLEDTQRVEG